MASYDDPTEGSRGQRADAYADAVRKLFNESVERLLRLGQTPPDVASGQMYSFDGDTAARRRKAQDEMRHLHSVILAAIEGGVDVEWAKANEASDRAFKTLFGPAKLRKARAAASNGDTGDPYAAAIARDTQAREAFKRRAEQGLDLSDRVWHVTARFQDEMEVALTVAIGEGKSAQRLATEVKHLLNDPDLAFRRFRFKTPDGQWSRKWKRRVRDGQGRERWVDYDRSQYVPKGAGKTSRGVYKSARKNAMRLARTEANVAYRRADSDRWRKADYILGFEVATSRDHPEPDICDQLAGKYPKGFRFDGWHPQCLCHARPLLMPPAEAKRMMDAKMRGEPTPIPQGLVREAPEAFKAFAAAHPEAWCVRGNERWAGLDGGRQTTPPPPAPQAPQPAPPPATPDPREEALRIASERHERRTAEQEEAIRKAWKERGEFLHEAIVTTQRPDLHTPQKIGTVAKVRMFARNLVALFPKGHKLASRGEELLDMYDGYEDSKRTRLDSSELGPTNFVVRQILDARTIVCDPATPAKIAPQWRGRYAALVKAVNAAPGDRDLIEAMPLMAEAANIARLSTNADARAYGLDRLSTRTPAELFTVARKVVPNHAMPPKGVFDALHKFVPLCSDNDNAYFVPDYNFVNIGYGYFSLTWRIKGSQYFQKAVYAHEFGHALDFQLNLRHSPAFDKEWGKLVATYDGTRVGRNKREGIAPAKDKAALAEWDALVDAKVARYEATFKGAKGGAEWERSLRDLRLRAKRQLLGHAEQLGAYSDCMQALDSVSMGELGGHPDSYWLSNEKRRTEFLAHCSEIYWMGNDHIRGMDPALHERMKALWRALLNP